MQVREKGRKVLCIRTEYVPEKKRTYGRTVASQESYLSSVSEEVRQKLTADEVRELEEWLTRRSEKESADRMKIHLSSVARWMEQAAIALDDDSARSGLSSEQADAIWQAHEKLSKALRRHGYRKPKSAPKKPRRREDQPGLPFDDRQ